MLFFTNKHLQSSLTDGSHRVVWHSRDEQGEQLIWTSLEVRLQVSNMCSYEIYEMGRGHMLKIWWSMLMYGGERIYRAFVWKADLKAEALVVFRAGKDLKFSFLGTALGLSSLIAGIWHLIYLYILIILYYSLE